MLGVEMKWKSDHHRLPGLVRDHLAAARMLRVCNAPDGVRAAVPRSTSTNIGPVAD